jgi:type IV pilus assembly protein PilX
MLDNDMLKGSQGRPTGTFRFQSGFVLVSSLLLLLIVTIMALSIFRSFGVQEKIAGNTRDKQRALQAAMSTQQFAETWLVNTSNAPAAVNAGLPPTADITCSSLVDANTGGGQLCINSLLSANTTLTSVATVPWSVGVQYTPPNMNYTGSTGNTSSNDVYYARPEFYITDLGPLATNNGEAYKVDAYSYGTSPTTAAVVESTFAIICIVCNVGAL